MATHSLVGNDNSAILPSGHPPRPLAGIGTLGDAPGGTAGHDAGGERRRRRPRRRRFESGEIDMVATRRTITLSLLLTLLLAATLVHRADAQVFRPRSPTESSRLDAKSECQTGGGTQFQTVYHYNANGVLQSMTTTCHGGSNDGETCTITANSRVCASRRFPRTGRRTKRPTGRGSR